MRYGSRTALHRGAWRPGVGGCGRDLRRAPARAGTAGADDGRRPSHGRGRGSCSGSHGATPQQIDAIEQALRAMPQVESITFRDQQTAYELFVEQEANRTPAQVVEPADMPESFRLKMKEDTDWTPILEAAMALPGVSNVINEKCVSEYLAGDSDYIECSVGGAVR
ncbi:permease-like cell division protein FtsX [Acrocarpospora sp. B8E8]|uniref:permease-like cell division protein FtsX n=1 Tax=Acrocarpospora sp. B8E8 TaxID=3153572 RepID=UPI00325F5A3E